MTEPGSVETASIHTAELFDEGWYLDEYPDVKMLGMDAGAHFLWIGKRLGRKPSAVAESQTTMVARRSGPESPFSMEQRAETLVDAVWYLKANPDVTGASPQSAWHHFADYGMRDGRNPSPYFHTAWYRASQGLVPEANPLIHYLSHVNDAGVDPNPFFSGAWYRERYMRGQPAWMTPLEHYMSVGWLLGNAPHPAWHEEEYVRGNQWLARQINEGMFASGYEHFCSTGHRELANTAHRRLPFVLGGKLIDFEEQVYLEDNPDVARMVVEGRYQDGVAHFFREGYRQCQSGLRAPFSPERMVRLLSVVSGQAERSGRHIALFAHYDADGIVDEYVFRYLDSLIACGADIIFITAACREEDLARLRPMCRHILFKNEVGRDFGSWYIALKHFGLSAFDEYEYLLFVNDSVYFPVNDPRRMFTAMPDRFDMWGITDTYDADQYHIQSWFLAFNAQARATVLSWFVERYERNVYLKKWGQIAEYELGLTARAREAGLRVGAWCSIGEIQDDLVRRPDLRAWKHQANRFEVVNPTHDLWDLLIQHYDCPALKLELVRDNPNQIHNVERYPELLPKGLRETVTAHAARQKRKDRPVPLATPAVRRLTEAAPELVLRHDLRGIAASGRRLVLLAHYDSHGFLDPYVIHMMDALNASGCDIVLITGSKLEDCWEEARTRAVRVLVKADVARDFGSWFLAVQACKPSFGGYESVIWMNDSIYFPLIDPNEIFEKMERFDFWGLIDSHRERHHVMSWFWAFGRKLIEADWFTQYERDFSPHYGKWEQIRNFEMRYPEIFRKSGLSVGSWVKAQEVIAAARHSGHNLREDANVMHEAWRLAVTRFGLPAMKVELLRYNPLAIDVDDVLSVMRQHTIYDPALIAGHLRRVKCGHIFGTGLHARSIDAESLGTEYMLL